MAYVDGFVIPIQKKKLPAYLAMAKKSARIWKEYGCLEYRECVGDDLKSSWGIAFPTMARAKPGETIVFSWIVYKNKAQRDSVNKKIMKDPRLQELCDPKNMPFDPKRMAYGGFTIKVAAD
ncbi:MAG: DUF1428 domain-containing protein [Phycisphaerales bacterium]